MRKSKFAAVSLTADDEPELTPGSQAAKRGRPKGSGKAGNPNYTQMTIYVPKDLHTEIRIEAFKRGLQMTDVAIERLSRQNSIQLSEKRDSSKAK